MAPRELRLRAVEAEGARRGEDALLVLGRRPAAGSDCADELAVDEQRNSACVDDALASVVFQPQSSPPGWVLGAKSPLGVAHDAAVNALPTASRIAPSAAPSIRWLART